MRWSGGLVFVPVLLAASVAACPCMEGFPAMGHNPEGTLLPRAVPPTVGCGATPVATTSLDDFVALPLLGDGANAFADWKASPAGPSGIRVSGSNLVAGPLGTRDPSMFLAPVRADGGGWQADVTFKMGGAGEDPIGNASFAVRFAILDAQQLNWREGPALTVHIDNQGADGYPVTAAGGSFTIHDGVPHNLSFRQTDLALQVLLDGRHLSTTDPIGLTDECVSIGFSGPTRTQSQPVTLSRLAMRSLPDLYANQRLRYGYAPETPPVNPGSAAVAACSVPEVRCNLVEGMAISESVVRCDDRSGLVIEDKPNNTINAQAANAALRRLGCGPDWRAKAVLWQVADGLREAEESAWPNPAGARTVRYTDTDTVMYGPDGRTTFGCNLIREHILIQMHYTAAELTQAGVTPAEVAIHHWDGKDLRTLKTGLTVDTLLGKLSVKEAGRDDATGTAWAIVKLEDNVDGRILNNDFATIKLSEGKVLGNGYLLGAYDPPQESPAPAALGVLLGLLLAAAMRRRAPPRLDP